MIGLSEGEHRPDVEAILEISFDDLEDQINQPSAKFELPRKTDKSEGPVTKQVQVSQGVTGFHEWTNISIPMQVQLKALNTANYKGLGLELGTKRHARALISRTSPTNIFGELESSNYEGETSKRYPRISLRRPSRMNVSAHSTDDCPPLLPALRREGSKMRAAGTHNMQPSAFGLLPHLDSELDPEIFRSLDEHLKSDRAEERSWALSQLKRIKLLTRKTPSRVIDMSK